MKFSFQNILFLATILCFKQLHSQQVSYSEAKKISSKSPQFRILGKNNEGIILHEYGKTENAVEAYTPSMKVKWRKNLNIRQVNSTIKRIIVYPDTTNIIYVAQEKEKWTIYAQSMDAKFTGGFRFMILDSVFYGRDNLAENLKVVYSKNRSKIVAFYPVPGQNAIHFILLDKALDVLMKQRVDFPLPEGDYRLNEVVVDNEGNIFVALFDNTKLKKADESYGRNRIFRVYQNLPSATPIDFNFTRPVFGSVKLDMDNINKQVVVAGFISDDNNKQAKGYFFKAYSLEENQLMRNYHIDFSTELYIELAGKESGQNLEGLSTFEITDLVLRFDGGIVIVAESRFNNIESIQMPSFVPAAGPSFRSVTVNYYNDVMALCITPDGKQDWAKVLRKKQVSEDDEGFFSSYALHIRGGELNLIYNEDIYQKTNVASYRVDPKGETKRSVAFNSGDEDVLVVPRLGKQVSSNETIMPSFRKNSLRLVKLTYN
jgi:hypothetical protein